MSRLFGSVRARATLGATLVVAVALVAAGTAVLLSLRSNLLGEAGTQAERSARDVATELAVGTRYTELSLDVDDRPVQIVDEAGGLVAASEDLERITGTGVDAVEPRPAPTGTGDGDSDDDDDSGESLEAGEIGERTTVSDGTATIDGDTEDYRFAAVPVETRDGEQLTVWAGAPLSAEHGAVNTALTVMLIGFPLLLAVVAWVTWLVTGRALRPVEGIRREMAAITASEDLARRVPVPGTHDEVARLASTTNETLAALETSVERQRRFVADASHELRSPIASLRTQLEVAAAHPELLDLDGAVEDTVRLQRLAADLLLLARLDAGERPADARVDLAALAREEAGGRTGVRVRAEDGVTVAGSRGQLGRVLANLLDNAQRHARSAVEVAVRRDGGAVVVAVADDGEGVPAADRERIFERFVRLDAARSRDDGGAGLGLAIARDVAVRHGGTLTVHDAPAGGALFELRLPGVRADSV
ncbi:MULTISPECIES: sensor histidine kinase [Streptomyces]|uniref:histidine kinase n=1 Tax=Streptomyces vinaceusdrappus TaxID=67376 RepID=A0ABY6C091_9ACTN|nr:MULTISPECIES: ATP-binding protein [Streptomyces]GGY91870.1 two-component sensor histidine kinase [Streptomyces geysiriensis]PVD11471.1 two-component sensor histidine kinase [Streptomyces sp. CS207]RSS77185.1 sensor histidine kinase [Streptomyces sp. WAC06128]RSS90479.1 sensor histidine kinase [Streptomyces sp. WAC02707]UXI80896.1 ATP-binding protein [Streptomyces vinaceusdrappus]